jgi:hypothetical protein
LSLTNHVHGLESRFKQVKEGSEPIQRLQPKLDPIDSAVELWRTCWFALPMSRLQMHKDIKATFLAGEIVVLGFEQGSVRSG